MCPENVFESDASHNAERPFGTEDLLLPDVLGGYREFKSQSWPLHQ